MTIKAYFSNQAGAPVLNGLVGSMISVLDACLVNGFNQVAVTSMVRTGSTVVVTCAAEHGYENPLTTYWVKDGVVNVCTIAGAVEADYNGDWPISYINPITFSFDIGTATPSSPATGTITTKRAAAGFSKAFSDTNRAAYRSNDITSRRHYWQVNDVADCPNGQGARYAGMRGFEKMSGIDHGENPFPTVISTDLFGIRICKSNWLDSIDRHWSIYSDGKTVIVCIHPEQLSGNPNYISGYSYTMGFGDLLSPVPDPYATICGGLSSESSSWDRTVNCGLHVQSNGTQPNPNVSQGWNALARTFTGAAKPAFPTAQIGMSFAQNICMGYSGFLAFPDPMSNRMQLAQVQVYEKTNIGAVHRGALPLYESGVGVVHQNREIIENVVGREGRKFQYIRSGVANSSYVGGVYIDLTGNTQGKWS
jgi:hypothetical protein